VTNRVYGIRPRCAASGRVSIRKEIRHAKTRVACLSEEFEGLAGLGARRRSSSSALWFFPRFSSLAQNVLTPRHRHQSISFRRSSYEVLRLTVVDVADNRRMRRSQRRLGVGTERSTTLASVTLVNGSASLVTSTLTTDRRLRRSSCPTRPCVRAASVWGGRSGSRLL